MELLGSAKESRDLDWFDYFWESISYDEQLRLKDYFKNYHKRPTGEREYLPIVTQVQDSTTPKKRSRIIHPKL